MKHAILFFILFAAVLNLVGQNVGIGTNSPKTRLHLGAGSIGVNPYSLTSLLIESTDRTYLQFLTPANKEAGVMFGNPNGTTQGGVYYNNPANPEGLDFRTNGNIVRMEIDNAGIVEMKSGLVIKGNNPATNAILVSKDMNGTTAWQRAYAFKVEGLVDGDDKKVGANANGKVLFDLIPVYNLGQTYISAVSEYTVPVKGIYFFDVLVRTYETAVNPIPGSITIILKRKRNNITSTLQEVYNGMYVDGDINNVNPEYTNRLSGDFLLEPNDLIWVEFQAGAAHTIFGSKANTSFSGRLVTQLY